MLYLHSGRDIDETATAEDSAVQGTELIVASRDDLAEPFSKKIRPFFQSIRAPHKDHALVRNRLFDVRVDRLAIKLSFDSGQEFSFALGNAEALERLLNLLRNIIPTSFCRLARSERITNHVEVYFLEFVAGPMRWKRFALKDVVGIFAEIAYPVRLALNTNDIIDGVLRRPNTCVASRFEIIEKVADITIVLN